MTTSEGSPLPSAKPTPAPSKARTIVLLGLLGIMLFALWYDYKIARPAVEDAYARIAEMNRAMNSKGGKTYMTNDDVQRELKRQPIETFTNGGYMVEVYGWRAGLPTKSHKYYAVYADGTPFIFLKHYMNDLDMKELESVPLIVPGDPDAETTELVVGSERRPGGPAPGMEPGVLNPAPLSASAPIADGGEAASGEGNGDSKSDRGKEPTKATSEPPQPEKKSGDNSEEKSVAKPESKAGDEAQPKS